MSPRTPPPLISLEAALEEMDPILRRLFWTHGLGAHADDLVAETRRIVLEIRARHDRTRRSHPWIMTIAHNVMDNYKTKYKPWTGVLGRTSVEGSEDDVLRIEDHMPTVRAGTFVVAEDQATPEVVAMQREARQLVWTCLRRIGDHDLELRSTFALHLTGIPGVPLAEQLGIQYSTGQWRINSGKAQIKDAITAYQDFRLNRAQSNRYPWTAAMDLAAKEAWHWIWALPEPEGEVAALRLFGSVRRALLKRFDFTAKVDQATLQDHEARMQAAGWN